MKYVTAEHDETYIFYFECNNSSAASYIIWRCDMAFIEPMHRNKPNITYLLILFERYQPRQQTSSYPLTENNVLILICKSKSGQHWFK